MVGQVGFLWLMFMPQALEIKSNIETRRSRNQFGIIIWQLNEARPWAWKRTDL